MGIENLNLKLIPHRILDKNGRYSIEKKNSPGSYLSLDSFEKQLVDRFNRGQKLSQLILELRGLKGLSKFQRLYDLLKSLVDKSFIEDQQLVDFISETSIGKSSFSEGGPIDLMKNLIKPLLKKEDPQSHVEKILSDESKSFTQRFNELPFIRNLPDPVRKEITKTARKIGVSKGTTLIREGEHNRDLYVLIEGQLGLYKFDPAKKKHGYLTSFKSGAVVGEAGFFLGQKRGASLLTLTDCKLVKISYIDGLITGQPDQKRATEFQKRVWYLQALSASPSFKFLPSEAFDQFLALGNLVSFERGQTIYQQHDKSDSLAIIVQGQVEATDGMKTLRVMEPGEVMGEIGVLSEGTLRTLTLKAASKALLCIISYQEVWKYFSENLILAIEFERLGQKRVSENPGSWS